MPRTDVGELGGRFSDREALRIVCSSFPGRDRQIVVAFRDQPSFQQLCLDYGEWAAAIDYWNRASKTEAQNRSKEYSELLRQLAQEIESWLGEIDGRKSSMNRREE